ncbi:hypothetical protein AB0M36_19420 [Actinoplanes sp. NPDC051346]|uniref:hypothetical protein n=1 Tax=Actinoplanes sp. NPDC051346 TaxID=3155048 RepID=UPI003446FC0B
MTGAEFSEVDFDLLADYVGGALDGTPDEAVVSALIVGHPAWRRAHAELSGATEAMTAALQSWGAEPEPMPADVIMRLDTAFAAANASDKPGLAAATTADAGIRRGPAADADAGQLATGADAGHLTTGADAGRMTTGTDAGRMTVDTDAGLVGADAGDRGVKAGGVTSGVGRLEPGRDGVAPVRHLVAVPNKDERPTRRVRWVAPMGIAAGLVAFLGFGISQFGAGESREASTSAADSAAGQGASRGQAGILSLPAGPAQVLASGTDYTAETLTRAALPLATADSGRTRTGAPPPGEEPVAPLIDASEAGAAQSGAPRADEPETDESRKARGTAGEDKAEINANGNDPLQRLRVQEMLLACIDAISDANQAGAVTAQSIDYARFEGDPALVVKFTASNGTWVWAAGADCGTPGSGADRLGAVKVG